MYIYQITTDHGNCTKVVTGSFKLAKQRGQDIDGWMKIYVWENGEIIFQTGEYCNNCGFNYEIANLIEYLDDISLI